MIDSIDFRISEDGKQVEIGLFEGEECQQFIPIDLDEAKYLQSALAEAIAAVTSSPEHR